MLTPKMAMELAYHEGIVRQAYKDSVGVWTWSIGITSASGHRVERYIGNPQPMRECLRVYIWALERYAKDVSLAFSGHTLTEEQFAAALSFHYNTGAIKRASWVKMWKSGDVSGARKAIMNWRKPAEIIPRRKAERDLFFNGKWSNDGTVTEYQVTPNHSPDWRSAKRVDISREIRDLLTQKPASPALPEAKSPSGWAALVAAILSIFKGSKA